MSLRDAAMPEPDTRLVSVFVALRPPDGDWTDYLKGENLVVLCRGSVAFGEISWALCEKNGFGRLATNDNGVIIWHGDRCSRTRGSINHRLVRREIVRCAESVYAKVCESADFSPSKEFRSFFAHETWIGEIPPTEPLVIPLNAICGEVLLAAQKNARP